MVNGKRKGNRGEAEAAKLIEEVLGIKTRRSLQAAGNNRGNADLLGWKGVHPEVKRQESLNIWKALHQAETEAINGDLPVVIFKRNRSDWYIAMRFKDLPGMADLVKEACGE